MYVCIIYIYINIDINIDINIYIHTCRGLFHSEMHFDFCGCSFCTFEDPITHSRPAAWPAERGVSKKQLKVGCRSAGLRPHWCGWCGNGDGSKPMKWPYDWANIQRKTSYFTIGYPKGVSGFWLIAERCCTKWPGLQWWFQVSQQWNQLHIPEKNG